MKKLKTGFGLSLIAAAFALALTTSNDVNALKYFRWQPGETEVNPLNDCEPSVPVDCAAIFEDDGTPTGQIYQGEYLHD